MNDRTRWDDPRHERGREDYRYRQQGGGEGSRQSSQFDQRHDQPGGWQDHNQGSDYRSGYGGGDNSRDWRGSDWRGQEYRGEDSTRHRDWGEGFGHAQSGRRDWSGDQERQRGQDRPWGGSSGQPGYSGGYDNSERGSSAYGYSRQDDLSARRDRDWQNRDNWRAAGSQSFASDYGMRDGANYDSRERTYSRSGGAFGGASSQGYGRGYGPDYGREEGRGFFERAGDEIASWFGDDDAARRRERDQRADDRRGRDERGAYMPGGHSGRGPSDYTRSDERIREDANDRLTEDRHIDATQIRVSVDKGEVTLSGMVDSRVDKRHAEDVVDRISGVKHVQNNLRVQERQGSGMSSDSSSWTAPAATNTTGSAKTATATPTWGSGSGTGASGSTATGTSTTGASTTGGGTTTTGSSGSDASGTAARSSTPGSSSTTGPGGKGPVT